MGKSSPDGEEGPAGAAGETERRPRVGVPYRRAKRGSLSPDRYPAPWVWDPPPCGGRGAPGEHRLPGTQPGLSSLQLQGGQKCSF